MNLKRFHFYYLSNGLLTGDSVASSVPQFTPEIPEGCGVYIGVADWRTERIDVATGRLIANIPPAPSDAHEWHEGSKRWRLTPETEQRRAAAADALIALAALDVKQLRALAELNLSESATDALTRLADIERDKEALRVIVRAGAP